jgi:hypothetical protein
MPCGALWLGNRNHENPDHAQSRRNAGVGRGVDRRARCHHVIDDDDAGTDGWSA